MIDRQTVTSAVVIKQRLDPLGFTGGINILKGYLPTVRPQPANRTANIHFKSAPSEQM
jgi:hypothetical protein